MPIPKPRKLQVSTIDSRSESGQPDPKPDIFCFSHLRWDFVFQRPQHLLTRFAKERRVFYVEEPVSGDWSEPNLRIGSRQEGVILVTPQLPARLSKSEADSATRELMNAMLIRWKISKWVAWYYTPMALAHTAHLNPNLTVYDCMDELSGFTGAPAAMQSMEKYLLGKADLVFTGGVSLYEAKKDRHARVYPFPSSIDTDHFLQARTAKEDPADQKGIGRPRIGFHGVLDERLDLDLLAKVADLRPDWNWVLIGPVCKIDPSALPRRANIHYLGKKEYTELPRYLGKWDLAMMPFAHNAATRFISPTKTPEYLAAGRAVVSTSIRDVVDPYGREGLVLIADTPAEFVRQCESAMAMPADRAWQAKVSRFLSQNSWDRTWGAMDDIVVSATRLADAGRRSKHV